ncbi:hypothetical protein D9X91_08505 [Falsibacillus albus]|uniref:Uncharacterized protein n=1 Tax=Falsibacillus albus TaxID=2478915 RepID=A0A3L7K1T3_9BACI|nr:hypothetical protein D9X91_08505 [Falsibacillus albus]
MHIRLIMKIVFLYLVGFDFNFITQRVDCSGRCETPRGLSGTCESQQRSEEAQRPLESEHPAGEINIP